MKNKAGGFLKRIISLVASMARAKTLALKSKTSALRTRLIIFSLVRDKRLMVSSISQKLQALTGQHHHHRQKKDREDDDPAGLEEEDSLTNKSSLILYHQNRLTVPNSTVHEDSLDNGNDEDEEDDDDDKYPDLTHSLFDLELEDAGGSVIEMVKNSKKEGEEFSLEQEIDHVADLFIKRFHRQMRLQKQLSLKRYEEMIERSA